MKKIILFLILINSGIARAQNLVPNPSFEIYDTCPCGYDEIRYAIPWYNADVYTYIIYFNACNIYGTVDVPKNGYGYQNAHTGVAYAGIWGYSDYNPLSERCYVGVELTDSLIEGKRYCISFYVSLADSSEYAITRIGVYLSDTIIFKTSGSPHGPFLLTPQILSPPGIFINDTANWTLISGEYIAEGGEKFITIGNYNDNANTDTIKTGVTSIYYGALYYLDDVSVSLCDTVSVIENPYNNDNNIIIYPNPFNTEANIVFPEKTAKIEIYDLLGRKITDGFIITQSNNNTYTITKGENIPEGVYLINFLFNNKIYTQKLIITN